MASSGIDAEKLVLQELIDSGASCEGCAVQNTKLPGKADVLAKWPSGKKWRVQVKSTSIADRKPAWPSKKNLGILKSTASNNNERAVVALVYADDTIEYYSARTKQLLTP